MLTLIIVGGVCLVAGIVLGLAIAGWCIEAGVADAQAALSADAARWRALEAELRSQGWQCISPQLIAARLPAVFPSQSISDDLHG